jgi:PAS domain S-box-containing protein
VSTLAEKQGAYGEESVDGDERQLRALLDRAPDGIFVADDDDRCTFVNETGCRLLGYTRDELLGMTIRDLIPAEDVERLLAAKTRLMAGESSVEEWRLIRKDGSLLSVEVSANVLPSGQWQGFVRDISERKANETEREALLEQTEAHSRWLQSVVETLPLGVLFFYPDGRIAHNRRAEEILGMPLDPSLGTAQFLGRILYPDGRPMPRERLVSHRVLREGETLNAEEYLVQRPDGARVPLLGSAAPIFGDGRRILGAVCVFQDMSERMRMEEAIRRNERLLQGVFDLLPVGVWIADPTGRIRMTNPAGERIWAGTRFVGPEEFNEYKAWWVETGERVQPDDWGITRAVRYGESSRGELLRIQCFDGSFKTIINWAAPIRSDLGEIVGAIAVNEDVTSLQQTQEQLRKAVREREQILAIVAHDLRNPLHRIMLGASAAEIRAADLAGGEPVRALAASLVEITGRMSGLVDDLLAVAVEATDGRSMLKLAPVPAATLLAKVIENLQTLLAESRLQLEIDELSWLPVIYVDEDRILRVFANLLDNALKFTTAPGRIRITTERIVGGVRFTIANSGESLSPDETAAMFHPFWQATGDRRGAGLGLAICRSIVEAHGGSIWAESAEGERVRVCFILPRKSAGASLNLPDAGR